MAYDEEYLKKFISKLGMSVNLKRFSDIGVAYFIDTREKELER